MTDVTITDLPDETGGAEVAEVVQVAAAAETSGLEQGLALGELLGTVQGLLARLDAMEAAQTAALDRNAEQLAEVIDKLNAIEDAENIEAAVEVAEAETLEDLTEAVEVEAAAEVAEVVNENLEDEVTPGSRRTHWYYRTADEWRRN